MKKLTTIVLMTVSYYVGTFNYKKEIIKNRAVIANAINKETNAQKEEFNECVEQYNRLADDANSYSEMLSTKLNACEQSLKKIEVDYDDIWKVLDENEYKEGKKYEE